MATIADFVPYIIRTTGALPEVFMQSYIRQAIADFMEDTHIALDELYITLDCNERDFLLDLPECRSLVRVKQVWEAPTNAEPLLDEDTWSLMTPEGMSRGGSYRFSATRAASGGTYRVNKTGRHPNKSVILSSGAKRQREFCVVYAWKIPRESCEVPDFILDDWVKAIVWRTMFYAHSSLDFEDRNTSERGTNLALYDLEVARAKNMLRADYTQGKIRLKTPAFY
jgi:hypothetical protein